MTDGTFIKDAWIWLTGLKNELLKHKSLRYMLLLAFSVAIFAGMAVYILDPNIHSLWDGIWYAWVTMTHVGYGDVVPTSFLGRTVGSLLILFSIAMIGLFTAIFSAILIRRDVSEVEHEESEILAEIKRLHERLDKLEERK